MGGGRKKGEKKQNKEETASSSESDALQDMFISLMKQDDEEGCLVDDAQCECLGCRERECCVLLMCPETVSPN